MRTKTLEGLKKPLSVAVLGTMTFGDTVDEAGSAAMLEAALDAGITTIDTANGYAGGASEEILGRLLRNRFDDVLLATKAGIPHPDAGQHSPLSATGLRRSLEGSLSRLGTDRVDLFYLHQPDRAVTLSETLGAVAELVAEGKIRAIGVSNFAAWQISELNIAADHAGAPRPVVAQQLYNLVARRIEEEYAEFAHVTGLHTMVYNPLGGGLLTGRHSFESTPKDGRFGTSRLAEMYRQRYWDRQLFEAVSELSSIAESAGMTLVELAFRWLLSQPVTGSILFGGSKPAQLAFNLEILERGPLDPGILEACHTVGAALRGPMPNYNR
ncbi:MAG: aldo/keto reductase [Micrococcaceae bacterium]|nr:aldo/keto reductase [Micrococcaceae bacterium]